MTDQDVTLRVRVNANGVATGLQGVKRELAGIGDAAESGGRRSTASLQATGKHVDELSAQLSQARNLVVGFFGAFAGAKGVGALADLSDSYTNINSKIGLVTESEAAANRVREQTFEIAQRTRSAFESTAELYTRMARSSEQLGLSEQQLLRITQTINETFVVSGATAQEASNAIIQLSQGLAAGALRGEEFNSVNEQAPLLLELVAKSLGVTRGALRGMAEEGELTAEVLTTALLGGAAEVSEQFDEMALTFGGLEQRAGNAATRYVGWINQITGASSALIDVLSVVVDNFDLVATGALGVATVIGVNYVASMVSATLASAAKQKQAVATAAAELLEAQAAEAVALARLNTARLTGGAIAAEQAYAAAVARTTVAQQASAAAAVANTGRLAALGRGALALAGGPIGLLVVALGGLGLAISSNIQAERDRVDGVLDGIAATEDATDSIRDLGDAMRDVPTGQVPLADTVGELAKASEALAASYKREWEQQKAITAARQEATQNSLHGIASTERLDAASAKLTGELNRQRTATDELSAEFQLAAQSVVQRFLPAFETAAAQIEARIETINGLGSAIRAVGDSASYIRNAWNGVLDADSKATASASELEAALAKSTEAREKAGKTAVELAEATGQQAIEDARAAGWSETRIALLAEQTRQYAANTAAIEAAKKSRKGQISDDEKARKVAADYVKSLRDRVAALGLFGQAARDYAYKSKGLTDAQREEADQLNDLIDFWEAYTPTVERAGEALDDIRSGNRDLDNQLAHNRDVLAGLSAGQIAYNDALREANELIADALALGPLTAADQEALEERLRKLGELLDQDDGIERVREEVAELDEILRGLGGETQLEQLARELSTVQGALERGTDAFGNAFSPEQIEAMHRAVGNLKQQTLEYATGAISQGISGLKSMAGEGTKAYKALEVAQTALNLATAIGAIANQGMGDPYTAIPRIIAMAAMMAQLVDGISGLSGGGPSRSSAAYRQEHQGTGSVLGDEFAKSESIANAVEITADATSELVGINRGMLNALQAMQAGISGASNYLARGAGDIVAPDLASGNALGSFLQPGGNFTILGALANSIFGGSQELIDQGVQIVGGTLSSMIDNIMARTYQTIETDGGWFHSDRTNDQFQSLSNGVRDQLQLVLSSLADAVRAGAEALGLNMDEINAAIDAYRIEEIRISTLDLSAEEARAELEAVFSEIFDGLAGDIVPFIDQFQVVGEGLGETLIRVATEVQVMQEAVRQLGLSLDDSLGPEAMAQVSDALITAVGGVDQFISQMQSFVSNFAPAGHAFEIAQDQLTRALDQVGLAVPPTRDAMWQLMQSLDATTEQGREQIATLLRLASAADDYYDGLEDHLTGLDMRSTAEAIIASLDAALGPKTPAAEALAKRFADTIGEAIGGGGGRIPRPSDPGLPVDDPVTGAAPIKPLPLDPVEEILGEASQIAQRWRGDAEDLLAGAQFLLTAFTDMRHGLGLLERGPGSLTAITDLVEELAIGDEQLIETYTRLQAESQLLQDALDLMGVTVTQSGEDFVRFADDIANAAGGMENAQALWSGYFERFYTDAERAAVAAENARQRARGEFGDIGLNLSNFDGAGGLQAFRDLFEEMLPRLSADAVVEWLQAADALGLVIDAEAALSEARGEAVDSAANAARLADLLDGLRWDDYLAGLSAFDRQVAELNRTFDEHVASAIALAASEADIAEIEALRANALERLAEAQRQAEEQARRDAYIREREQRQQEILAAREQLAGILEGLRFEESLRGLSDYEIAQARLNQQFDDYVAQARTLYASQAELAEIEAIRAARLNDLAEAEAERMRAEIGGVLDGLRWDDSLRGLSDYDRQLAEINRRFDEYRETLIDNGASEAELAELETYRLNEIADLVDTRYETEMQWLRRLMDYRDSLLLDDNLTTLTPAEQLAEARRQYEAVAQAALAGDTDALNNVQNVASAYLDELRAYFGSAQGYTEGFDEVMTLLDTLIADGAAGLASGSGTPVENQVTQALNTIASSPLAGNGPVVIEAQPIVQPLNEIRDINRDGFQSIDSRLQELIARVERVEQATTDVKTEVKRGFEDFEVRVES